MADDDEAQLLASTCKLLDLVEREQAQLVVFGHDGEQRKTLEKIAAILRLSGVTETRQGSCAKISLPR